MSALKRIGPALNAATLLRWAGVLPILTVNLAYAWNLAAGLEGCFPYVEGCTSVSRGVRSGPGLWLFKVMALPIVVCLLLGWRRLPPRFRTRTIVALGTVGALSFLVYAMALGTDGQVYRWMRRYGVVLYFGLTGLAQLLLTARLRRADREDPAPVQPWRSWLLILLVVATWSLGVLSALKRRLFDDPAFIDRLQNTLEWNFALGLSLVFVALAFVLNPGRTHRAGPGSA